MLEGFAASEPDSELSVPPDAANIPLPVISFIFEPEHIFLSNGGSYAEAIEKVRTTINEMFFKYNVIVSFIYAGGKGIVYPEPWANWVYFRYTTTFFMSIELRNLQH